MNELTAKQADELRDDLLTLHEELGESIASSRDDVRPVQLDEPIGRLTRLDAIQQQQMARANRESTRLRLRQVDAALAAIEDDGYGWCRRCDEPIGFKRLKIRPEGPLCMRCLDALDGPV